MSKFYTIKEVLERYNLKTRQSFYNWTKALELEVQKDIDGKNVVTEEQVKLLDELSEHLKNGGTLKSFSPTFKTEVDYSTIDSTIDDNQRENKDNKPHDITTKITNNEVVKSTLDITINNENRQLDLFELIGYAVKTTVKEMKMATSPISHWDELNKAEKNGYILTTLEIRQLLGVKPTGNEWVRGAFKFIKVGKIGNQSAWKIEKISY